MSKLIGLTKRITAMFLSGILVIGSVSTTGVVLAADPVQTSEVSEEVLTTDPSEASADVSADEAAQYYTVTLDANGGYFENEWDDIWGVSVEQTEVINKQILVGGTVVTVPVFTDPDGQTMLFAGWSLEPNGELVTVGDEEYTPVDSCVLYAVWQAPETDADVQEDGESQEYTEESAGLADTTQETEYVESEETCPAEESETDTAQDPGDSEISEESGTESEETEVTEKIETDTSQKYEDTETDEVVEDTNLEDDNTDNDTVSDAYTVSEADEGENQINDNQQDATSAQIVLYSDEEEQETSEKSSDASVAEEETNPAQIESLDDEETVREDAVMGVVSRGTCGENLAWTLDDTGTLAISGTGEMEDYAPTDLNGDFISINGRGLTPWYEMRNSIKRIEIQEGVTSIGMGAFALVGYNNPVEYISIPNSVSSIGPAAFSYTGCPRIEFDHPIEFTTIVKDMNTGNTGSISVFRLAKIDEVYFSCEEVTEGLFADSKIKKITLTPNVKTISSMAFRSCDSLTSIVIPNSVTTIGNAAFYDCDALTSITIPDSVTSLGNQAFYICNSLKSVTIGSGIDTIDRETFESCYALERVIIKQGVKNIGDRAFHDCRSLRSLSLPVGLQQIRSGAFSGCTCLENVIIPEGVTVLDYAAFYGCNLNSITLPSTLTTIESAICQGSCQ